MTELTSTTPHSTQPVSIRRHGIPTAEALTGGWTDRRRHSVFRKAAPWLPLMLACLHPVSGQEATVDEETIFVLPPFTVDTSRDDGYLATNSISGSVISIPTRDLPFSLQVINADFVEDLHATDLTEALQYSAGIFTETFENRNGANQSFQDFSPSSNARADDPFADRVVIRGYPVPNQQRNGFRIGAIVPAYGIVLGGSTDTAAVERFEVVKGPSSILYGINVLSGVVNLIPKRPLDEPQFEISASVGSDAFFRSTLDATGPVIKDVLSYRAILAYQENGDWTDFHEVERQFGSLMFDWDITPKVNLFVDVSKAVREESGFGTHLLQDGGARNSFSTEEALQGSNNLEYVRNEYGEFFTWGLDFDEEDAGVFLDPQEGHENEFPNLGYGYRISGPDTFREQEEWNSTAILTITPTNHLRVELGMYNSRMEESNRLLDMASVTGGEGRAFVDQPAFSNNPDYNDGRIIEVFPVPSVLVPDAVELDKKFARYYWYTSPVESDSMQMRGRALYSFEKDIFGINAHHNFIGGFSYIEDEVSFISDNSGSETLTQQTNHIYTDTRQAEDPYYLRSIFDYSPVHYTGQALAIVGDLLNIGEVTDDNGNPVTLRHLRLSGQKNVKLWYRGAYGIYQGEFWSGRATFIGGIRQDAYQVRESEKLRLLDRPFSDSDNPDQSTIKPFTNIYHGSGNLVLPYLAGKGLGPYKPEPSLPDAYHDLVREEYRLYQQAYPRGTYEHLFDESQTYLTKSAGLSVRVTEAVSVYGSYAEGIFPNTGLRDGNYEPIKAEETESMEIGAKFEFEGRLGKFSGDVALYRMKRFNAVTKWIYAPNPSRWYGGADPINRAQNPGRFFDPGAARGDLSNSDYEEVAPVSYGVAEQYMRDAWAAYGLTLPGGRITVPSIQALGNGFEHLLAEGTHNTGAGSRERYFYFKYTDIISNEAVKFAFDNAILDQNYDKPQLFPIDYNGAPDMQYKNNPSNPGSLDSFVTYEEEETGVDVTFFYKPFQNYQIVFGFSHFDREIIGKGFDLVVPKNSLEGDIVATEYDIWVYILGPDAFDDPTDPTTTNGKGVNGTDLAFVPHTSMSLWNKYSFTEGWAEGLEIGAGVIYSGAAPTSTTIGGERLQINQYRTPDLEERYTVDALVSYLWRWKGVDWRLSLRVSNLLNDRTSESIALYEGADGEVVQRRAFSIFAPRSFRLNLTASF